jgi:hypothetical protein
MPPSPVWSSAKITYNPYWGTKLADISTGFQHLATVFSGIGGGAETIGALIGSQKGTAIGLFGKFTVAPLPYVEYGAGLAGFMEGASEGHLFHKYVTNPAESWASRNSSTFTIASDFLLGNTRLDLYNDHAELVIGQPTATAVLLTFVGGLNPAGVIDFPIDLYGSFYAEGKLPGVYDITQVIGNKIKLASPNDTYPGNPNFPNVPQSFSDTPYDGIYLKFGDTIPYAP